jgi:peptidyl-prolyl cis-trans isomerase A (cyclophilin A)
MTPCLQFSTIVCTARATALAIISAATLAACGGGGGGDTSPATVSSMSISSTMPGVPVYGVPALVTVNGTNLSNLTLTAPGCKNITRLTSGATTSTDTTSYYSCTPSGTYSSTVTASTSGTTLSTQTLTVLPPVVTMAVSGDGVNGNIVFALKGNQAPITVDNFLAYVNAGFYNGLIFHRVVPGFVVQGGGYGTTTSGTLPTPKVTPYAPIALELTGGSNAQWTAAMARGTTDNSATSQFFFNLANNASTLDPSNKTDGYAVFADVSASASVIQAIANAPGCTALISNGTAASDGSCVPIPNVVITSARQTQ